MSLVDFFDFESDAEAVLTENQLKASVVAGRFRVSRRPPEPQERRAPPEARSESVVETAPEEAKKTPPLSLACRKCGHAFGLRRTRDLHEARCSR